MKERWNWLVTYAAVIVVALVLAAALGATDLFSKTRLIDKGLSASHLVRFLGYGSALAVLWLAAYRASGLFREMGARWRLPEVVVLPLTTLIVIASGHSVLLLVLNALIDKTMRPTFDWVFILGIVASYKSKG